MTAPLTDTTKIIVRIGNESFTASIENDYEIHILEATYEAFSKVPYKTQQRMLAWLSEKLAWDKEKMNAI